MSSHAATKIDQKEYLKKYLSGDTTHKKKKKKKDKDKKRHKVKSGATVKFIDDDYVDANEHDELAEEILYAGEDAPQIVGEYIAEASEAIKWRSIAVKKEEADDEDGGDSKDVQKMSSFSPIRFGGVKVKDEPQSPPRDRTTPDLSPRREEKSRRRSRSAEKVRRRQENPDQSPPRRGGVRAVSPDQSPPRRRAARQAGDDQSPPRRRREQSPPRRGRDQSPQRRPARKREPSDDQSPPRRSQRSPPARRGDHGEPRRRSNSSDQSPPRRRRPSPARVKRERRSRSRSPATRNSNNNNRHKHDSPPNGRRRSDSPPPTHKPKAETTKSTAKTTLDGKKAGLQNAAALRTETDERRRREAQMYEDMPASVSGRDAEVRVRATGRKGKRAREAAAEDPEMRRQREERAQQKKEVYERWGKGVKQVEDHRQRLAEQEHESSKPLARYANDADLEQHLREQERADDPMLEYMRKKKRERQQDAQVAAMPVYEGSFPENRFGIRPGYRWDGVDRSNGYEKRWFDVQSEKRARQEEAYLYSVEDM